MTPDQDLLTLGLVILGTMALRAGGVVIASHIRDDMRVFEWVTCVAFAIAAGIMVKVLLLPAGVLAEAPPLARATGAGAAIAAFLISGKRLFVGLATGVLVFLGVSMLCR
jgi:hypothetical protein